MDFSNILVSIEVTMFKVTLTLPCAAAATFNQWRVVLSVMESEESAPKLHELKHAIINTELKNLYVGITRARHRTYFRVLVWTQLIHAHPDCWLWDSSQQGEPMVKYWLSKGLVKVQGPGDPIPQLASMYPYVLITILPIVTCP